MIDVAQILQAVDSFDAVLGMRLAGALRVSRFHHLVLLSQSHSFRLSLHETHCRLHPIPVFALRRPKQSVEDSSTQSFEAVRVWDTPFPPVFHPVFLPDQ